MPTPATRAVRRILATALTASALAVLAACGGDTNSMTVGAAPVTAVGGYPATVEHRYGSTTVPKAPQRIVTVGLMEQDAVLALGQAPIATTEWFGEQPGAIFGWAKDELGSKPVPQVLRTTDGIPFEKIAALKPDLILGIYSALTAEDYAKLSTLAPTVAQPAGQKDWTASWQDVTLMTGKALGRGGEADALVTRTEKLIADTRAAHRQWEGKTATVAGLYQGVFAYGSADARGRFVTSLGFTVPAEIDKITGTGFGGVIGNEKLDILDTDVAIWLLTDYAAERKTLDTNPVYPALGVAEEGRDIFVAASKDGAYYAATSFITVLSIPHLLDTLAPQLDAAVDGDPATVTPGVGSQASAAVTLAGVTG